MMHEANGLRRIGGHVARVALLALALGSGVALGLFAPVGGRGGQAALACGFETPQVMLANNSPSLFYPVTKNIPADQPVGLFALNYAVGQPVAFVEDLSRVPNLPTNVALRWSFGDGSGYSYGVAVHHSFAAAGIYNVHVQIQDPKTPGGDWPDIDSAQITVVAAPVASPPVAKVTASATVVNVNGTITFDASGSHAADGSQLTYLWNFNDGQTAAGPHVSHQFVLQAQSIVALIVTDKRGGRSVATTNVLVAPELTASASAVQTGDTVSFDVSAYVPPPGQGPTVSSFTWSFGDGSAEQTTQAPTATHAFATSGTFTVTVRAGTSKSAQVLALTTVKVQAVPAANGSAAPRGPNWGLIIAALVAALLIATGGVFGVRAQVRRGALIRERQAALERARARAVRGTRREGRVGMRDPRGPGGGPPPITRYPERREGPRSSRGGPPASGNR
jgi:PKD repeat protein